MPHPTLPKHQSGFTLIEIAIVLVIIGLLLGGILKGQELINSARVKNLATDFRNIPLFIYGYQDRFRVLPGDDPAADTHVAGIVATTPAGTQGNGVINGNWNSAGPGDESFLFWEHVRRAQLAPGTTDIAAADYRPGNAAGGRIGIQSGTNVAANAPIQAGGVGIRGAYIICSEGILGSFAIQLDTQMDDANTATGSMMATPTTGYAVGAVATPTANIDPALTYTICLGV